jgi:hypothetical protein
MDVLDLDWLPGSTENGYTIATASVDNRIMIWGLSPLISNGSYTASTLVSPRQVLSGHDSFVKGLSYDPMGRYLISSGSDNLLIVWDTQADYTAVRTLDEPLRNSPDKTIYRRISWAPDGQSVCVTSAQKSNKPVGMVLKRGTWESVADLVGHAASSISAKFCPHVLQLPATASESGANQAKAAMVACTVALGDQNGVVSVWSTHSNRPLYVLRDVCDGAVTDIAWARGVSQTVVVMCGIDGTVVLADLEAEIGRCMPPAVLERHFQSLYGRNANEMQQRPQALVESALALKYAQSATQPVPVAVNGVTKLNGGAHAGSTVPAGGSPMSNLTHRPADASNSVSQPTLQIQQTTQTIGGKKRIRPVLMVNNLDTPDEVSAAVLGGPNSSNAAVLGGTASAVVPITTAAPVPQAAARSVSFPARLAEYSADEGGFDAGTASDNGGTAKRMRPVASNGVNGSTGGITASSSSNSASVFAAANSSAVVANPAAGAATPRSSTPVAVSASRSAVPAERFLTIQFSADEAVCTVPLLNSQQRIRRAVAVSGGAAGRPAASTAMVSRYTVTAQRLAKPALLAQLRHSGGPLSAVTLSPSRSESSGGGAGAGDSVEAAAAGLWTAVLAGEVTCVAATAYAISSTADAQRVDGLCLVGCSDGTLHCFDLSCGVRVGPPVVLGCAVAHVDIRTCPNSSTSASDTFVALGVTADGEIWKWKVNPATLKFRCVVRTNLKPIILSMKSQVTTQQGRGDRNSEKTGAAAAGNAKSGAGSGKGKSGDEDNGSAQKQTSGPSFAVQRCLLSETGDIQVHVQASTAASEGGAWQAFSYDADAMAWQRLADMRHVLSR